MGKIPQVLECLEKYHPIPLSATDLRQELKVSYKTIVLAERRFGLTSFMGYGNQRYWRLPQLRGE